MYIRHRKQWKDTQLCQLQPTITNSRRKIICCRLWWTKNGNEQLNETKLDRDRSSLPRTVPLENYSPKVPLLKRQFSWLNLSLLLRNSPAISAPGENSKRKSISKPLITNTAQNLALAPLTLAAGTNELSTLRTITCLCRMETVS